MSLYNDPKCSKVYCTICNTDVKRIRNYGNKIVSECITCGSVRIIGELDQKKEPMSKAFRIPTVDKDGFGKKARWYYSPKGNKYHSSYKAIEKYQAFNLPIIKGNPFVKVNAN